MIEGVAERSRPVVSGPRPQAEDGRSSQFPSAELTRDLCPWLPRGRAKKPAGTEAIPFFPFGTHGGPGGLEGIVIEIAVSR